MKLLSVKRILFLQPIKKLFVKRLFCGDDKRAFRRMYEVTRSVGECGRTTMEKAILA
jgi:hypothetical protein